MTSSAHPRPAPLDEAHQRVADALLAPLTGAFPIVELFWQDTISWRWGTDAASAPPRVERVRGAQLHAVAERATRTSWTTDLSVSGLRRAFDSLEQRRRAPLVPSLPELEVRSLRSAQARAWIDALETALDRVRAIVGPGVRVDALVEVVAESRASSSGPGLGVTWAVDRATVNLTATGHDGQLLRWNRQSTLLDPRRFDFDLFLSAIHEELALGPSRTLGGCRLLPVVLAPGGGSVFFHELLGHPLEADHVLADLSPFSNRSMGDQVTLEELSVRDTADPDFGCCSPGVDDQGVATRTVQLLERGRVAGLLHDRVTAFMTGDLPTGNGRREDFRHPAAPRCRNTVVSPGPSAASSLLSGIREGIYVERVGAGRSDGATRRFAVGVERARMIVDGRLGAVVRDLAIRGEILPALAAIEAVGDDAAAFLEPLPCGKGCTALCGAAGPTIRMGPLEVIG